MGCSGPSEGILCHQIFDRAANRSEGVFYIAVAHIRVGYRERPAAT